VNVLVLSLPVFLPSTILVGANRTRLATVAAVFHVTACVQELHLAGHQLHGSLPLSYTTLSNLRVLDISRNRLSGTLPNTISGLSSMQQLNISGNDFEGPLPQLLFGLQQLQQADFSSNNFNGELDGLLPDVAITSTPSQ
jgi:hypothetical protein